MKMQSFKKKKKVSYTLTFKKKKSQLIKCVMYSTIKCNKEKTFKNAKSVQLKILIQRGLCLNLCR